MSISKFIPLMVPDIQQQDIDAVVEVLKSGMLVQGSKVLELEKNVASYLGIKYAIAVSSGTATLHLALKALGIGEGDEVIVPAFSFIATANVVELVGARPIFVDIDIKSFNIDINLLEKVITPKTKAIVPVHEFGLASDIHAICEIAKTHNIYVIEDAACALGATENDEFAGTLGIIGSFSFHPRKAITSGEGGMLVTNSEELANKLRILRNHGAEMYDDKIEFIQAGFNYRLTDIQAALVNSQLTRLEAIVKYKVELANIYLSELKGLSSILLPVVAIHKRHTWQSFHIVLDNNINRDRIIADLRNMGVGTNNGAQCIPSQKYFQDKYKLPYNEYFPNALKAFKQGLVLPLYNKLNPNDILDISSILKSLLS